MRRHRHAKIVATLGPASSSREVIQALFDAGTDVFRFNFSHGSHEDHRERLDIVRDIEPGPAARSPSWPTSRGRSCGSARWPRGRSCWRKGARIRLDLDPTPGSRDRVPLPHPEIFAALSPGVHLLVDDGKVRLEIEQAEAESATARVLTGGRISERKGVSVVGAVLPVSPLTEKDRRDLTFALELGVDWVALSFVQRPEDMDELRELVGGKAAIMAKLEKPSAIERLEEIVDRSDAVMVARGDLGVEMQPEQVPDDPAPGAARRPEGRQAGDRRDPDAGIHDRGADPHQGRGLRRRDRRLRGRRRRHALGGIRGRPLPAGGGADDGPDHRGGGARPAITARRPTPPIRNRPRPSRTRSATACARRRRLLPVAAIVTHTTSGSTALRAARERPAAPILSLTPDMSIARRLALVWGVHAGADQRDGTGVRDRGVRLRHRRSAKDWPSPAKSS